MPVFVCLFVRRVNVISASIFKEKQSLIAFDVSTLTIGALTLNKSEVITTGKKNPTRFLVA